MQQGQVLKVQGVGYIVPSRSVEGALWLVEGADCSCPAGRNGAPNCWHRRRVAELVREENERHARPSAPPNVAALCD